MMQVRLMRTCALAPGRDPGAPRMIQVLERPGGCSRGQAARRGQSCIRAPRMAGAACEERQEHSRGQSRGSFPAPLRGRLVLNTYWIRQRLRANRGSRRNMALIAPMENLETSRAQGHTCQARGFRRRGARDQDPGRWAGRPQFRPAATSQHNLTCASRIL